MKYFNKGNMDSSFFGKGSLSSKLIGASKLGASILDDPLTHKVVSIFAPEIGMGLGALKHAGIFERLK